MEGTLPKDHEDQITEKGFNSLSHSLLSCAQVQSTAELEPKFHKYKGRVVLRGDVVKDYSGSYAVHSWEAVVWSEERTDMEKS